MSVEEFLGGVRVLQPSAKNLRDPPLWMFLTPSLRTENPGTKLVVLVVGYVNIGIVVVE